MHQQKTASLLVGVAVVAIAAALAVFVKAPGASRKPSVPSGAPTTASAPYTAAQIAGHAQPTDCWTSINDDVYDLTQWIAQHPGGERAIIGLCGKDGSAAFNGQHGGQGAAMSALTPFKIGTLAK